VDSGKRYGLGNVNRCLSIAKVLSKNGHNPIFFISSKSTELLIKDYGYKSILINQLKNKTLISALIKKLKIKILIIDSKKKEIVDFKFLKNKVKIVLIDNQNSTKYTDLVVLPGVKEQFLNPPANCLIGSKYIILNPNFKKIKTSKLKNTIFISMGGSDKYDITSRIIKPLKKTKLDFLAFIILGKFYSNSKKIHRILQNDKRFILVDNPQNLHEIIAKCQFGIISFGITVYEAAALNIPTLVISHSFENHFSAKRIKQYGWFEYLGKYDNINYSKVSEKIISKLTQKQKLKIKKSKLFDLKGPNRICKKILELIV
jgi:spore coat polysaccharide biosynthesis predicted glycosyltransferase SpsG